MRERLGWLVRGGFVARGVTYGIIGALALALALGAGGGAASQQGALATLDRGPVGATALALVALGLLAYALWKFLLCWQGTGPEGGGGDGANDRLLNLAAGFSYLVFAGVAGRVLVHGGSGQDSQPGKTAAGVLGWPGGRWIVALGGLILIIVCLVQIYLALTGDFLGDNKTERMGVAGRDWFGALGRVGLTARALVFILVGYFLLRAAVDFNPNKAIGVDGALRKVAQQPYGGWLLGLVAAGLIVFAVFSFAEARFRRL